MSTDDERWERSKKAAQMRASGLSVPEIADSLQTSAKTVQEDLSRFFKRFLDFQLLDGTVLGELLFQIDNIIGLALSGYSRANRTVFNQRGEPHERPDHYARRQYLSTALDAVKEKSAVLGFKRTEASPILQIIQGQNNEITSITTANVDPSNIPELRRMMRRTRAIFNRDPVKTMDDVERKMLIQGVKEPPYEHELPGVLLDQGEEPPKNDQWKATAF
jgi:hypothetical protein